MINALFSRLLRFLLSWSGIRRAGTCRRTAAANGFCAPGSLHCGSFGFSLGSALVEVSAVSEVLQPPTVRRLYFWALQVTFSPRNARCARSPSPGCSGTALSGSDRGELGWVCACRHWRAAQGVGILASECLAMVPTPATSRWEPGRRYHLRCVAVPSPDTPANVHSWRTITDLESGRDTRVRDLHTEGISGSACSVDRGFRPM